MLGGAGVDDLVADDVPEPAAGGVESLRREPIVPARTRRARLDPSLGGQHLEMPADGGLGQLEDRAELVDGQLVALEGEEQPAPRWVGEGCHLPEQGGGGQSINPFIRIKGYMIRKAKSTTRFPRQRILTHDV